MQHPLETAPKEISKEKVSELELMKGKEEEKIKGKVASKEKIYSHTKTDIKTPNEVPKKVLDDILKDDSSEKS